MIMCFLSLQTVKPLDTLLVLSVITCTRITLTISGFEKSMLINLYLGDLKFVLKVNSVPSLVMY